MPVQGRHDEAEEVECVVWFAPRVKCLEQFQLKLSFGGKLDLLKQLAKVDEKH